MVRFYENDTMYAIKEKEIPPFDESEVIEENINRFYMEYKVTRFCEHPHIIKFHNFFRPENTGSNDCKIIMEYAPLGDIGSFSGSRAR